MSTLTTALKSAKMSQAELARELKVTAQVVHNWIVRDRVPAVWAPKIETILGVDRRKICPDFPWQ